MVSAAFTPRDHCRMTSPLKPLFDLEDRTAIFATNVRSFVKKLPSSSFLSSDITQVIRSSGSIGANYIEANESLGKKDFLMHIRISRKEAKETRYWLNILKNTNNLELQKEGEKLVDEARQLERIFGSIVTKVMASQH